MGAWIEIINNRLIINDMHVAPHDGCVDWNYVGNYFGMSKDIVAPHDGCVDWNNLLGLMYLSFKESHPTMGAWIEIALNLSL